MVEVVPFDLEHHSPNSPWLHVENPKERWGSSGPLRNTAYQVCRFKDKTDEQRAAYMLLACAVENDLDDFRRAVLAPYYRSVGDSDRDWWHCATRRPLPDTRAGGWIPSDAKNNCRELVRLCAQQWRALVEEWKVVRIPDFMEPGSHEHTRVMKYYAKLRKAETDVRERAEYERLRRKFEGEWASDARISRDRALD